MVLTESVIFYISVLNISAPRQECYNSLQNSYYIHLITVEANFLHFCTNLYTHPLLHKIHTSDKVVLRWPKILVWKLPCNLQPSCLKRCVGVQLLQF